MARLIDVDALKMGFRTKECAENLGHSIHRLLFLDDVVDAQPTVDAVEVVRCKDCKYRIYDDIAKEIWCNHIKGMSSVLLDTDFCSYGERRTDEAD